VAQAIAPAERTKSACRPLSSVVRQQLTVYATIPVRRVRIAGDQRSGWSAAEPSDSGSFEIDFRFTVTDDGNANYLLVYSSHDNMYFADTWHETLEGALDAAREEFGIEHGEWTMKYAA